MLETKHSISFYRKVQTAEPPVRTVTELVFLLH